MVNFHRCFSTLSKPRILYFGSDKFSCIVLDSLLKRGCYSHLEIVLPFNTAQPLKKLAHTHSLPWHQAPPRKAPWDDWKFPAGTGEPFDLGIVVSFGYFLPKSILQRFSLGTLNVHPSLLPMYRGSSPIQYAIWNQDPKTGVSIIELSPKAFDSGQILNQKEVKLDGTETFDELHDQLALLGGEMLCDTIERFPDYQRTAWIQDESKVTKAPKISIEQSLVDWANANVDEVFARFKAFGTKIPLYSYLKRKKVKFLEILPPNAVDLPLGSQDSTPGTIIYQNSLLFVKCKDGFLPIKTLVMDGKKPSSARDFRNGYLMDPILKSFEAPPLF